MGSVASIINAVFGVLFAPFRALPPIVGLMVISAATGVVMLLIFGRTSNQNAIRAAKARLKAHIAEIWLFRDDLVQMMGAFFRVLAHTGRYFLHSLRPLIFIMLPVLIIMVMLGVRYQYRPLRPGETATVAVVVDNGQWTQGDEIRLNASPGIEVVSQALRIPSRREINWRIRANGMGEGRLTLTTPSGEIHKKIVVSDKDTPLMALAPGRGRAFSEQFLTFPAEPPLPGKSGIRSLEITDWPSRELRLFGFHVNWLVAFFVISLAAGFGVKGLFRVEV